MDQDPESPSVEKEVVQTQEQNDSQIPRRKASQTKDQDQTLCQATESGHDGNLNAVDHIQSQNRAGTHIDFVTLGMFIIGESSSLASSPLVPRLL